MSKHPIHPHYGPCDAMADNGECYECRKQYAALRARLSEVEDELNRAIDWAEGRPWNDADYITELETQEALAEESDDA